MEYIEKNYLGSSLDHVVNKLLEYHNEGLLVSTNFNGTILYSDTVTLDGAYVAITGKTYAECKKAEQEWHEEYQRKEKEWQDNISDPIKQWKNKARGILSEDKLEYWDKIVPIRASDLYHGMELDACLDIVKLLNNGHSLDDAKAMFDSQGHSGMSGSLVCSMVKTFCDRGEEFVAYVW